MKTFYALVTLMFVPLVVFAQDMGTATSTAADASLEDLVGTIPSIVEAFSNGGLLAGLAAIFAAGMVALNFGPIKAALGPETRLDWVRPLLMLLLVGAAAGVGSAMAGASVLAAVIAGVMAGLSSGFVQKLIQEASD
jgi:hypothetical protein